MTTESLAKSGDIEPLEIIQKKRHSFLWKLRIARDIERAMRASRDVPPDVSRFRDSLSGKLPASDHGGGIILAACDDRYYRAFAPSLVNSLERVGERQALHLHLCEPTTETIKHIETLRDSLKNIDLTWTIDPCLFAEGLRYRTIYLAAARFLVASFILARTDRPLLCIDVDTVANRPVWQTYDEARRDVDIVVIRRTSETSDSRKVRAGAFGINPTPQGKRFAECLTASLAGLLQKNPRYHLDQIVIHYLMQRLIKRNALTFADMPPSLSDFELNEGSTLWMAKGWAMKNLDVFRNPAG